MRIWKPLAPPKDIDSRIYEVLRRLNEGSQQVSKSINNITNQITVLGTNPDLTNYFYLPGRATGQFGLGSNQGTYPGVGKCLTLQGFNGFGTSATPNSARVTVEQAVQVYASDFIVTERLSTYGAANGFHIATGSGFVNVNVYGATTRFLANSSGGSPQVVIDNTATGSSIAAKIFQIKAKSGQTGNLTEWLDNTGAILSRITSNGTFVGPIASTSAASFVDSLFSLVDNGDATKVLQFECSGITTATTRTLTVPDASGTVLLGDGVNNLSTPSSGFSLLVTTNLAVLSGAAAGNLSFLSIGTTGTLGYSSGSLQINALNFNPTITHPSGLTVSGFNGAFFSPLLGTASGGTLTNYAGGTFMTRGPTSGGPTTTNILGVRSSPGNRALGCTLMSAFYAYKDALVTYGPGVAATVSALEVDPTFGRFANATTWYGLHIPVMTGTAPGTSWGINIADTMNNQIAGKLALGGAATPAHMLDLAAGTTTIAPIRMAVAANILTTAVAGCHEYDGSLFYLTHSDAVRTAIPTRRGVVDLTAQAAAIGATTLYAAPAAGYYLVHYTLEDTAADITAGTIQFQVNYTDDIGATNQTGAALAMTAVGRDRGSFNIYMAAAGNIQYQTNLVGIVGTAQYALRVRLVHLG